MQKPTVLTKCSMEWSVSIIQTDAALRTPRTRRVTPTGPAHRASRSASPSDVMFAKACDLLWGREQGADQESEEVPTFTLADSSDDDEPEEPRAAPRRPRRKQSEVHGTVPTRSSARQASSTGPAPGFMSDIPRDQRGHAVMVRTDKRDLTVDERYQLVAAVKDGKAAGKKVADVLKEFGVGKNQYARYVKRLKEDGHLQSSKKGRVGAKRKVTGDLYEKYKEINRKTKGDKTYRELAALLMTKWEAHHKQCGAHSIA